VVKDIATEWTNLKSHLLWVHKTILSKGKKDGGRDKCRNPGGQISRGENENLQKDRTSGVNKKQATRNRR